MGANRNRSNGCLLVCTLCGANKDVSKLIWTLYRTQFRDGQKFDDPSALYFTELDVQSGTVIIHCIWIKYVIHKWPFDKEDQHSW